MASSMSWTAEELKTNASNWTLEGDCKLLEYMKNISQNIESRAHSTNQSINHMVFNLEETNVALENVSNKLSALQNSRFVENRVYEDDETIANVAEVPVDIEHETKKYDPTETLNKVLKNSLIMMENYYEKVSIDVEDSDDEEGVSKSVVFKPKNAFEGRSLPQIIGTKEWKANWHIGLCDSEEENSEDEKNVNEYSDESENTSLSVYLPSNERTVSESGSSIWLNKSIEPSKRYSTSSDEETSPNGVKSKNSSDSAPKLNTSMMPQTALAEEIERFYVHKPRDKQHFEGNSEESKKSVVTKNVFNQPQLRLPEHRNNFINGISNIFSDEPPELDEVDRKQERENSELFYESEDDLMKSEQLDNTKNNKKLQEKKSNIGKKPVNLFDDDDFDAFMEELDKKTTEKLVSSKKDDAVTNLFEDTIEIHQESTDVPSPFLSASKNVDESYSTIEDSSRNKKKSEEFLGSEHEKDIFKNISAKSKKIGTSSIRAVKNLFDDESSEDEFENVFKVGPKIVVKTQNKNVKYEEITTKITEGNLNKKILNSDQSHSSTSPESTLPSLERFLAADFVESKQITKSNNSQKLDVKTNNLFSDDLSDTENLFGTKETIPVPAKRTVIPADDHILPQESIQDASNSNSNEFEYKEEEQKFFIKYSDKNNHESVTCGDLSKTNMLHSIFLNNEPPDDEDIFRLSENETTKNISSSRTKQLPTCEDLSNSCSDQFNKHSTLSDNSNSNSDDIKVDPEKISRAIVNDYINIFDDDDFPLSSETVNESVAEIQNQEKKDSVQNNGKDEHTIEETEQINSKLDVLEQTGRVEHLEWSDSIDKADMETSNVNLSSEMEFAFSMNNNKTKSDINNTKSVEDISTVSVPTYNAISLFQDIPPEDDFQSSADSKRLHSIFYDDFAETIVPSNSNYVQNKPSNYFFSEEPPPDSLGDNSGIDKDQKFDEKNENTLKEQPVNKNQLPEDILEQTDTDNHFTVSELIKKVGSNQTKTDLKPSIGPPSRKKISNNLNINVAALLPGAKRPNSGVSNFQKDLSYMKANVEAYEDNVSTENENSATIPRSIISEDSNPQKLISLNKTRVKIQTKRRPSTRKGRQESYKQSLESDATDLMKSRTTEAINEEKKHLESSYVYPSDLISAGLEKDLNISNMTTFLTSRKPKIDDDWLRKPLHPHTDNLPINQPFTETKSFLTQFAEKIASESDPPLRQHSSGEITKNISVGQKDSISLFQDDSDDDLFSRLNENKSTSSKNAATLPKTKINTKVKIFSSDDDDDENDDIFAKKIKVNSKSKANTLTKPLTMNSKLFDDDDDDDDDLFGASSTKNKGTTRSMNLPPKQVKKTSVGSVTGDNPLADLI